MFYLGNIGVFIAYLGVINALSLQVSPRSTIFAIARKEYLLM